MCSPEDTSDVQGTASWGARKHREKVGERPQLGPGAIIRAECVQEKRMAGGEETVEFGNKEAPEAVMTGYIQKQHGRF